MNAAVLETGLSVPSQSGGDLTVWDRVNPMDFIDKMGKIYSQTGAGGCVTVADGQLMALACMSQKKDIFKIAEEFHLMNGKLVKKAERMLADFRVKAKGDHTWISDPSDKTKATLELVDAKGKKLTISFTIEEARVAGYIRKGSEWEKRPEHMLRARCITDGIGMLCPEVRGGTYSEEEMSDVIVTTAKVVSSTPTRTKEEVAKRAEELKSMQNGSATNSTVVESAASAVTTSEKTEEPPFDVDSSSSEGEIIDASFEVVNGEVVDTAVVNAAQSLTMEIEFLIGQLGHKVETILENYNKKNGTAYADFGQLSEEQRNKLVGNLRKGVEDHQARQLAAKEAATAK